MTLERSGGLVWLCYRVGDLRLRLPFRTEAEARQWFCRRWGVNRRRWLQGVTLRPEDVMRRK